MDQDKAEANATAEEGGDQPQRRKLNWVVLLSILVGLLFVLLIAVSVFFSQRNAALNRELAVAKKAAAELKALKEAPPPVCTEENALRAKVEAQTQELAAQRDELTRLKEAASAVKTPVCAPTVREERTAPPAPQPAIPPKLKRPEPQGQGCDLMGKSSDEQAAILKHCVGAMDAPPRGRTK